MRARRIWIINQYGSTPKTGIGGRHHNFARLLAARGHAVTVIAARQHHILRDPEASRAAPFIETIDGYRFVRLAVPGYAHAQDKRRVLAWVAFAFALLVNAWRLGPRPQVILISSLSLISFLPAELLARLFRARLVFEVRDIWPLSLVELNGVSPRHLFVRFLQAIERRGYAKAAQTITTLPAARDHMLSQGLAPERFAWLPNGVRAEPPVPSAEECAHPVLAAVRRLAESKFVIAYTGTHGRANTLSTLLEAAARLKEQGRDQDLAFVLVGQGARKAALQAKAQARGLDSLHFFDAVPQAVVPLILAASHASILCWVDQPLYRFGISANKLAEYMMAGKPILHAFSGAADPVSQHGLGLTVPAQKPKALAAAIRQLADTPPEQRAAMGHRARELALRDYSFEALVPRYEALILGEPTSDPGPQTPDIRPQILDGQATRRGAP